MNRQTSDRQTLCTSKSIEMTLYATPCQRQANQKKERKMVIAQADVPPGVVRRRPRAPAPRAAPAGCPASRSAYTPAPHTHARRGGGLAQGARKSVHTCGPTTSLPVIHTYIAFLLLANLTYFLIYIKPVMSHHPPGPPLRRALPSPPRSPRSPPAASGPAPPPPPPPSGRGTDTSASSTIHRHRGGKKCQLSTHKGRLWQAY